MSNNTMTFFLITQEVKMLYTMIEDCKLNSAELNILPCIKKVNLLWQLKRFAVPKIEVSFFLISNRSDLVCEISANQTPCECRLPFMQICSGVIQSFQKLIIRNELSITLQVRRTNSSSKFDFPYFLLNVTLKDLFMSEYFYI